MKRALKWIFIAVGVAAVGFIVFNFIQMRGARAQFAAQANQNYPTAKVERGTLATTILASGSVRAGQSAALTWQASGKVGQVNAALGDKVRPDKVLAELDPTSLPQNLIQALSDLINARQALQDLQDNSQTTAAEAEQALVAAQQELDDADTARASMNYKRASQDTIDAMHADLVMAQNAVEDAQSFYDQVKNRPETDQLRAQALSSLANAKKKRDNLQANYNYLLGGPDPIKVAAADARLALAQTKLIDAQRAYDRVKNGPSESDIQIAQNRVTIAQAAVNQSSITAPFAGTITELNAMKGDMVSAGVQAMRLDDLSKMFVDLSVTEVDINKIQVGQTAEVTLDAIPGTNYTGKVIEVGQVGTDSGGVVYFKVTVQLDEPDDSVRPGMTATASVHVGQQENVLLVANRAIRTENGNHILYVPAPQIGLRPVTVQVGDSDDTSTVIIAGVKEGDEYITDPPSTTTTNPAAFRGIFGAGPGGGPDGGDVQRAPVQGQP